MQVLRMLILSCGIVCSLAAQEATRITVAVIDLNADDLNASAVVTLSNTVRKELLQSGQYTVVDRSNMETLLKEQGFQSSGICNDLACMVKVGNMLGVQKMIGGNIGKLGSKYIVDLQIIDVESSRIDKLESENYVGPVEELDAALRRITRRLIGTQKTQSKGSFFYIASQPVGARVSLDSEFKGNAPLTLQVEAGKGYTVRAEMDQHTPWQQPVIARADETMYLNAVLHAGAGAGPVADGNSSAYESRKKSPTAAFVMSFLLPPMGHFYVGKTGGIVRGLVYTGALTFFALNMEKETKTVVQRGTWPNYYNATETNTETNTQFAQAFVLIWVASAVDAMVSAKLYNKELKKKYGVSFYSNPNRPDHNATVGLQYRF